MWNLLLWIQINYSRNLCSKVINSKKSDHAITEMFLTIFNLNTSFYFPDMDVLQKFWKKKSILLHTSHFHFWCLENFWYLCNGKLFRLGFHFGVWNKKFHNWFSQEYNHRNRQPKGSKGKTIDNKYCVKTQQEFYVWGFPPSIKLDCDCIYHQHETWDNKYINWWNKRNQSGRYIE